MSTQKNSKTISFFKFYNIVTIPFSLVLIILCLISNSIVLSGLLVGLAVCHTALTIISTRVISKEDE